MLRVNFRAVVVSLTEGGEDRVLQSMRRIAEQLGSVFEFSAKPYDKPPGSVMIGVDADCLLDPCRAVDEVIAFSGGTGWIREGGDSEPFAVWAAQPGDSPPIDQDVTWAIVETIPLAALPASRRSQATKH